MSEDRDMTIEEYERWLAAYTSAPPGLLDDGPTLDGYDPERDDFEDEVDTPDDYEGDRYIDNQGDPYDPPHWVL